jgi:hypothetical protein
MKNWNFVARY